MVRKKKIEVLQTIKQLIINALSTFSFASSFAKISTSTRLCNSFCLRMQSIIAAVANENSLYFKDLSFTRLQNRLQYCQLSASNCLQVPAVLLALCERELASNEAFNKIAFACLFAKPFCRMRQNGEGKYCEQNL
jgi:hypothetical protein